MQLAQKATTAAGLGVIAELKTEQQPGPAMQQLLLLLKLTRLQHQAATRSLGLRTEQNRQLSGCAAMLGLRHVVLAHSHHLYSRSQPFAGITAKIRCNGK
jgi:hypothetical protein